MEQWEKRDRIVRQFYRLFDKTIKECLSQEQYHEERRKITGVNPNLTKQWSDLTRYNQEYIHGLETCFRRQLDEFHQGQKALLVHCYIVNGVVYPIDSKRYKKLSPQKVHNTATWCGARWRKDLSKAYFGCHMKDGKTLEYSGEPHYARVYVPKRDEKGRFA
jgi:hypothetical protein